jgi:hypothetical protein
MASEKWHVTHCLLFAFQLKRSVAEAANMICSDFGEGAVMHKTCKKWYQRFSELWFWAFQSRTFRPTEKVWRRWAWAAVKWKLRPVSTGARSTTRSYPAIHFLSSTSAGEDSKARPMDSASAQPRNQRAKVCYSYVLADKVQKEGFSVQNHKRWWKMGSVQPWA